jgi:hypothetical protein
MCQAGTSKVVALPVSVKDRWVGPSRESVEHIDRVLVYGPSKPSSLPSTEGGFTPTASMVTSGRETRYEPANRPAVVLSIVSGALFLRSSDSVHCC